MEIQLWREILNPYDLAVKELTVKFEHLIQEHRQQGLYSPIEQVHGRVKTISSILDKAQKKNIPINEIEHNLEDIAGIRIICQFVEDIQKVVEIIRTQHAKAIDLLEKNRDKLDELAKYLCEKETITGEEFMTILEGKEKLQ